MNIRGFVTTFAVNQRSTIMKSPLEYTHLYGLIGYPLEHSFSCDYFNNKFAAEGVDALYINFEIHEIDQIKDVVARYPNLCGLNVTAPHKQAVIPILDTIDTTAARVGAVNVIKCVHGENGQCSLHGFNTDTTAFGKTVNGIVKSTDHAMVLGTGGAARAVNVALQQLGVEVMSISRHKKASTIVYEEITKAMVADCRLIVNATPLGRYPDIDKCPDFPYRFLDSRHLCYDLNYNPEVTAFLSRARKHGADTRNGLEMLLLQASEAYSIWNTPLPQ